MLVFWYEFRKNKARFAKDFNADQKPPLKSKPRDSSACIISDIKHCTDFYPSRYSFDLSRWAFTFINTFGASNSNLVHSLQALISSIPRKWKPYIRLLHAPPSGRFALRYVSNNDSTWLLLWKNTPSSSTNGIEHLV